MRQLVAIEGIDQSGKKTQANLLAESLRNAGYKASTISFPVYNSHSGRQIQAYLGGKYKLTFPAACMLYSLNRWEHLDLLNNLSKSSDFLVANRYTPSALAYGLGGGLDLEWLRNMDKGLPRPNEVTVLDVPVRSSFTRKIRGRDVHEADVSYLQRVRRAYLKLAKGSAWKVVDGTGSIEEVHLRIMSVVQRTLSKRSRPDRFL